MKYDEKCLQITWNLYFAEKQRTIQKTHRADTSSSYIRDETVSVDGDNFSPPRSLPD